MACSECEDLLLDYDELPSTQRAALDAHLSGCEGCRAYLQFLADIDGSLTREFSGEALSADFASHVREQSAKIPVVKEPSWVPAALDLVGAVAASGIVLFLVFWFEGGSQVGTAAFVAVGMLFVTLSAAFAWRTLNQS